MKPHVQLQDRDLRMLSELAAVGLLDTELIHRRHFNNVTRRRCQQRLQQLQTQGTLKSVSLTVWHGPPGGGQVPTIHCLTERGAEMLASLGCSAPRRFLRSNPQPETLHHRLAVVQARLAFDDACGLIGLGAPEWIMEQDRRIDAQANDPPSRQRILYHEFIATGKKVTCQPDAACLVHIPRNMQVPTTGTTPLLLFWEVDRSTERTAQVVGKCSGYTALLEQREYRRYFSESEHAAVRVFWVCRSWRRVESLCAALQTEPVAQTFRFTTSDELRPDAVFTTPIWRTLDGPPRAILRMSQAQPALNLPLKNSDLTPPPHTGP